MKRFWAFCLLILVALSLFTGGVNAFTVLCIETDGRITIEIPGDFCCERLGGQEDSNSLQSTSTDPKNSCASCIDIPFPSNPDLRPIVRIEPLKFVDAVPAALPLVIEKINLLSFLNQLEIPSPYFASLYHVRTTILRF